MFKHFSYTLKGLALMSLLFALAGVAFASPHAASAATCNPAQGNPVACGQVIVRVVDQGTGDPITGAKVALIDESGVVTYAAAMDDVGDYSAYVTVGNYKVYATAPGYSTFTGTTSVQPNQTDWVKAPLATYRLAPSNGTTSTASPVSN